MVLAGLLLADAGQHRAPLQAQAVEPSVVQDALHQVSLLLHPLTHALERPFRNQLSAGAGVHR